MAMIQICDTCNTKIEGGYYILTIDKNKGFEYVNERKCRFEICSDCPAWKCSVCGDEFPAESNYCSNCGARVDKEKIKYIPDI